MQSEDEFKVEIQKAMAKIKSISSGRKYNMKSTHRIYESVRTAKSTASGSYKIYLSSAAGLGYSVV